MRADGPCAPLALAGALIGLFLGGALVGDMVMYAIGRTMGRGIRRYPWLARVLHALQAQLDSYRDRIEQRFTEHPDHDLFGSLPGAGAKLARSYRVKVGEPGTALGGQHWRGSSAVQAS